MGIIRKVVGFFVLAGVALPTLVAIIWAVGLIQATMDPAFFRGVVLEVVKEAPTIADEVFEAVKNEQEIGDAEGQAWVKALVAAGIRPSDFLTRSGLSDWMENTLAPSIARIGDVLSGAAAPESVKLDFRPLKATLVSGQFQALMTAIVEKLPTCAAADLERWKVEKKGHECHCDPPPCNPGPEAVQAMFGPLGMAAAEIPDEVPVFHDAEFPEGLDVLHTVAAAMGMLFFIPIVLILLGAAIAGGFRIGFVAWAGWTTLLGGLVSVAFSSFFSTIVPALLNLDPSWWHFDRHDRFWTTGPGRIVATRAADLAAMVVERLFGPVTTIGLVVSAIGGAAALIYYIGRPKGEAAPAQPAAPSQPART
jgi:hypothetical protein